MDFGDVSDSVGTSDLLSSNDQGQGALIVKQPVLCNLVLLLVLVNLNSYF